jgi:Uma2 family endonuclease
MTTALTIEKKITQEDLLALSGISWSKFEEIEAAFSDIAGVRFIYLDGVLEIMTLSPEHEDTKSTISLLLEAYMREQEIRFYTRGSATLGSKEIGGRKEPDESYNLETKKAIPDLVIEVIFTSGAINKLELYKRISIPEIWFWQDGGLQIYHLQEEYSLVEYSQLLPNLDLNLLAKYITYHDQYDAVTEFLQELRSR